MRPALTFKLEGAPCYARWVQLCSISMRVDRLPQGAPTTPEDPAVEFHADATGLARKTLKLDTASVSVTGSLSRHTIDLQAAAPDIKLTARLEGGWQQQARLWRGSSAQAREPGKRALRADQPAATVVRERSSSR